MLVRTCRATRYAEVSRELLVSRHLFCCFGKASPISSGGRGPRRSRARPTSVHYGLASRTTRSLTDEVSVEVFMPWPAEACLPIALSIALASRGVWPSRRQRRQLSRFAPASSATALPPTGEVLAEILTYRPADTCSAEASVISLMGKVVSHWRPWAAAGFLQLDYPENIASLFFTSPPQN